MDHVTQTVFSSDLLPHETINLYFWSCFINYNNRKFVDIKVKTDRDIIETVMDQHC